MQLNKLIFFVVAALLTVSANATNIKVRFLNGIQNDPKSIRESIDVLYNSYKLYRNTTAPAIPKENFGSYTNPKDPLILGDFIELSIQGTLAGIAEKYAIIANNLKIAKALRAGLRVDQSTKDAWYNAIYQKTLTEVYANYLAGSSTDGTVNIAGVSNSVLSQIRSDLQDGSSIVIVSHSQGNFFAEAINSQLTDVEKQKIRFVGVASVAASTPNNRYITFNSDLAVFGAFALLREKIAIFSTTPLNGNETGYYTGPEGISSVWDAIKDIVNPFSLSSCVSRLINCPSALGHSFTDVYMNSSVVVSQDNFTTIVEKIIGYVGESINELAGGLVSLKSNSSLPNGNAYDTVEWTANNFSKSVTIFPTYENPSLYTNGHAFSFINGNFFIGVGNTPGSILNWIPLNYIMPSNGSSVWAVLIDETNRSRWGYVKLR